MKRDWLDSILVAVIRTEQASTGLSSPWVRVRAPFDPSLARALTLRDALDPDCKRRVARIQVFKPEIITAFLEDEFRRPLYAERVGSDALAACARAFVDAAQAHFEAGETDWGYWWISNSALLDTSAGVEALDEAAAQACASESPWCDRLMRELVQSRLARVWIGDLSALRRLAAQAPTSHTAVSDWLDGSLPAALVLAQGLGFELDPAWQAYGVLPSARDARTAFEWRIDLWIEDWAVNGLLSEPFEADHEGLARLGAACAKSTPRPDTDPIRRADRCEATRGEVLTEIFNERPSAQSN